MDILFKRPAPTINSLKYEIESLSDRIESLRESLSFRRQQERDVLKKRLCKENGILLIVVPYNTSCIPAYIGLRLKMEIPFCPCGSCEFDRFFLKRRERHKDESSRT